MNRHESVVHKTNLFGAWCGIGYIVLLLVGWWIVGGFFPLHKPSASAEEIQSFFSHDVVTIRLGMVIVMWGAAVFIPFTSTIADFVARFEGRNGPLTRTMTMAGYSNALLTFYPPLYWIATTWRVDERSADTTRLLNDIGNDLDEHQRAALPAAMARYVSDGLASPSFNHSKGIQ